MDYHGKIWGFNASIVAFKSHTLLHHVSRFETIDTTWVCHRWSAAAGLYKNLSSPQSLKRVPPFETSTTFNILYIIPVQCWSCYQSCHQFSFRCEDGAMLSWASHPVWSININEIPPKNDLSGNCLGYSMNINENQWASFSQKRRWAFGYFWIFCLANFFVGLPLQLSHQDVLSHWNCSTTQPTRSTAFYANHLFCQSLLSFSSEENMPGRLHIYIYIYNTSPQT